MDIITDKGIAIIPGAVSIDNKEFDSIFIEDILAHYPNPFYLDNIEKTTISFSLSYKNMNSPVIIIFNINGQLVKQFHVNNNQSSIVWN